MGKNNGQFTVLAEYYDRLNGADHKGYADFVKRVFELYGTGKENILLDLGCGTGAMTLELAKLGYDMIGADISPDMLSQASERAYDAEESILFLLQDMRSFELYGTVQGIVCANDGINYLTEKEDVLKCFSLIRNYLEPDSVFIFDVNSEYRFNEVFAKRDFFIDDGDVCMGWKSQMHKKSGICEFFLSVFTENEDGSYQRLNEIQREKLWTDDELDQMLTQSGLEKLAVFSGFDMKTAKENDEKRFYVVKRA